MSTQKSLLEEVNDGCGKVSPSEASQWLRLATKSMKVNRAMRRWLEKQSCDIDRKDVEARMEELERDYGDDDIESTPNESKVPGVSYDGDCWWSVELNEQFIGEFCNKGDAERCAQGRFACQHCGEFFRSEAARNTHQRYRDGDTCAVVKRQKRWVLPARAAAAAAKPTATMAKPARKPKRPPLHVMEKRKNEAQAAARSAKAAKAAGEETIRSLGRELQKTKQNLSKVRGAVRNGEETPVLSHCLH